MLSPLHFSLLMPSFSHCLQQKKNFTVELYLPLWQESQVPISNFLWVPLSYCQTFTHKLGHTLELTRNFHSRSLRFCFQIPWQLPSHYSKVRTIILITYIYIPFHIFYTIIITNVFYGMLLVGVQTDQCRAYRMSQQVTFLCLNFLFCKTRLTIFALIYKTVLLVWKDRYYIRVKSGSTKNIPYSISGLFPAGKNSSSSWSRNKEHSQYFEAKHTCLRGT